MELRTVWERQKNRAIAILGGLALVLVPMIGYFSAQATQPKQVTFSLDGTIQKVGTKASTVEKFLAERNITVTEKDQLQPEPNTKIKNGTTITLHTSWAIPVQVDGQTKVVQTLKRDVSSVLQEAGIALGQQDRVEPGLGEALSKKSTIVVTRVEEKVVQLEEQVAFQELRRTDPVLSKGTTRVLQEGQEGKALAQYKLVTENGKEVSRELIKRDVITPKKDRIVAVGTAVAVQIDDSSNRVVATEAGMVSRGGKVFRPHKVLNGVTLTAYSPAGGGKSPNSPGYGRTATGVKAQPEHTIAVDPKVVPLGWWVFIDGIGYRRAEDTGGAIRGSKIDVFVGTEADAVQFGRKRNRTVYIIGPHKP
ncbi:G5 domain-containing protein [Brevibacillus ruminantium]|uniref:G5 domain-containing protein n=1 Tax=Brevibacillus ruminantium TaxID=2950604 RepID=A0ABY4WFG1_9BACL|nr:3D domain-containing protein [Brevibacillus ruminantium]USG65893.1 G5 domain-containing protein [Brevibacillus ruminantium]